MNKRLTIRGLVTELRHSPNGHTDAVVTLYNANESKPVSTQHFRYPKHDCPTLGQWLKISVEHEND